MNEKKAQTILYGVSPIGFGHASRAAAVGLKLRGRLLEPEFATGGAAVKFLESYGFKVHDMVTEPSPVESRGEMKMATFWYLRYWREYRATKRRMADLMKRVFPTLVVGDEEFACVSLAMEEKIQHALMSDELTLGFARSAIARRIESRVGRWYEELQRNVANLLIPSFGTDAGNVHYMTPVTREVTKTREAVRAEHNLPSNSSLVLFSSSGSGSGRFILQKALAAFEKVCDPSDVFAISGTSDLRAQGRNVRQLGIVRDNQNLIAAADLVISTAGKSTIDESLNCGTPLITIPIKNHAEQERNAQELGFSHEDVDRLEQLIPKMMGKRTQPADYRGAEMTAAYLCSLLTG